ncbi:MAG TPA: hypothetical protein VFT95_20730, partial [Micromonosporaceae bacterium]|nr:hypothetical protein [Micromonosporaceae bacterium]
MSAAVRRFATRRPATCSFVPPHIEDHIAKVTGKASAEPSAAQRSAVASKQLRNRRRRSSIDLATLTGPRPGKSDRQIYDCEQTWVLDVTFVRGEGDPAVGLESANLAYDNAGATREFYKEVLEREGYDNLGSALNINVNFGV